MDRNHLLAVTANSIEFIQYTFIQVRHQKLAARHAGFATWLEGKEAYNVIKTTRNM
jgi:hypothetical protein